MKFNKTRVAFFFSKSAVKVISSPPPHAFLHFVCIITVPIIGFEQTSYTFTEGDGDVEVCAAVSPDQVLLYDFGLVRAREIPGTAGKCSKQD